MKKIIFFSAFLIFLSAFKQVKAFGCPRGSLANLNCDWDDKIDEEDLSVLLEKWHPSGSLPTPPEGQRSADLNKDGKIDSVDLQKFLAIFLADFDINSLNVARDERSLQTVYRWETQRCEERDIIDSPSRVFVDVGGNVQLIGGDERNRRNVGPNLDELTHQCGVILDSEKDPVPRHYNDKEWLTAFYTLDGRNIYALIHTEYQGWEHNNCNRPPPTKWDDCWWNSVNLAFSSDGGATYSHVAPPNHNVANSPVDYNPDNTQGHIGYFQPSNIIFKDGYYYSLVGAYNPPDSGRSCLMRTVNLADPRSWRFWDGVGFNMLTDGGRCAALPEDPPEFSLSYNTYLKKYVALDCYPGSGCTYALSDDLIGWTSRKTLLAKGEHNVFAYGSLLQPGDPTRNFEQTGRSPWLYFVVCNTGVPGVTFNRDLNRLRVRFTKPGDEGRYELLDLQMSEKKGAKTLDSSFYNNNGALIGGISFSNDARRNFISFNGSGRIEVSHNSSLNASGQLTIEGAIRTSMNPNPGVFPTLVSKDWPLRNYGLYLTNGGHLHFSLTKNGIYSGSASQGTINDGQWHDIQVTYDNATGLASYFIDRQLDSRTYHGALLEEGINSSPVVVGRDFVGEIDWVTVYNYI